MQMLDRKPSEEPVLTVEEEAIDYEAILILQKLKIEYQRRNVLDRHYALFINWYNFMYESEIDKGGYDAYNRPRELIERGTSCTKLYRTAIGSHQAAVTQ